MHRLIGDNHSLTGLSFSAQVFLRALDGIRRSLAADVGVTSTELGALGRIAEESRISHTSLVKYLDLSEDAVTDVVDSLAQRHLVVRTADEGDATVTLLELTTSGHRVMEKVYSDFQSSIDSAADSLDEERRYALDSAMLKMARKLDAIAELPRENSR
jgi:MarR family 2-MHQ and catechol resistance regulon transcriptional repressor